MYLPGYEEIEIIEAVGVCILFRCCNLCIFLLLRKINAVKQRSGDMTGRKPNYGMMAQDASAYYLLDHPEEWRDIPKKYEDRLEEALLDLDEVLKDTRDAVKENRGEKAELVGVTNGLCCAHDVLTIFKEAGVTPPKIFTEIHRTLEKRREELDPKGHHL